MTLNFKIRPTYKALLLVGAILFLVGYFWEKEFISITGTLFVAIGLLTYIPKRKRYR